MTAVRPSAPSPVTLPSLTRVVRPGFLQQAQTRILLLYASLLLAAVGIAIPIFRNLLFAEVDQRVEEDLLEEAEAFEDGYENWTQSASQTVDSLTDFIDRFVLETNPEDDNSFIALIDGEIYVSDPPTLPAVIGAESALIEQWQGTETYTLNRQRNDDPDVGKILYVVQPLTVDGQVRGQFVIVHLSAGERQEALAGVYAFSKVIAGLIAAALVLAWLGTRRLLRPVRNLASTAKAINEADLTQRIAIEGTGELAVLTATFNAMMDRLQNAFDSQRDFINDAGHELRTPITIIQGHLELMGNDPEEQAETMTVVMDELERMGRLVNELVLLVKSERPDFLHIESVAVTAFTKELYDKAKTLAERDWQLRIEAEADQQMVIDRQRLTGALLNLLNNAAQHTTAADTIELGCRHKSQHVEFWVRDAGEGIPEPEQVRIFDRFARVQHTHRRSDGSGLGLAIVKAIAEAHGGRISLSSRVGAGSTFTMTIPVMTIPVKPGIPASELKPA